MGPLSFRLSADTEVHSIILRYQIPSTVQGTYLAEVGGGGYGVPKSV